MCGTTPTCCELFTVSVSLAFIDIQLLENASHAGDRTYIRGLDKCIQSDLRLGFMENRWIRTKNEVQNLMRTNFFATPPIDPKTIQYCVNDVTHLPGVIGSPR